MAEQESTKHSHNFKDLTGKRFGRLIVESLAPRQPNSRMAFWNCICECGNTCIVNGQMLRLGRVTSCKCWARETTSSRFKRHGLTRTREHRIWVNIRQRCLNPKTPAFKNYGGRGITICDRWMDSFTAFLDDMGPCPDGMTIDRIDNALGYSKDNCRWTTRLVQNRNSRRSIRVEHQGSIISMRELSNMTGIPYPTLINRHRRGSPLVVATFHSRP